MISLVYSLTLLHLLVSVRGDFHLLNIIYHLRIIKMTDHKSPVTVTGGCNCGSIRYTITFPTDTQWPPESVRSQSSLSSAQRDSP
jgi:hypothetical protein